MPLKKKAWDPMTCHGMKYLNFGILHPVRITQSSIFTALAMHVVLARYCYRN